MYMGMLGVALGGVLTGGMTMATTFLSGTFQLREARAQREHDHADRRQRLAAELLPQRTALVEEWRRQVRQAKEVAGPVNLVGEPWFESLRTHLSTSFDAEQIRAATQFLCDGESAHRLTREIAHIERRWLADALG
jgi:hypothetical protein